jgi:hypothetical protein
MSGRFRTQWFFAILSIVFFAMHGLAQNSTTGAISGTVSDPSNAVVPSATVTLTNADTGVSSNATANTIGS